MLDNRECARLLASVSVGRIAFSAGALPVIEPVLFALIEDRIIFQIPGESPRAALQGAVVAFQADDATPQTAPQWTVTVVAVAHLVEHRCGTSTDPPLTVLALDASEVTGRRL